MFLSHLRFGQPLVPALCSVIFKLISSRDSCQGQNLFTFLQGNQAGFRAVTLNPLKIGSLVA